MLQALYILFDDRAELQLRDQLSFMCLAELALHDFARLIVNASVVQARRPRLDRDEKRAVREGRVPEG